MKGTRLLPFVGVVEGVEVAGSLGVRSLGIYLRIMSEEAPRLVECAPFWERGWAPLWSSLSWSLGAGGAEGRISGRSGDAAGEPCRGVGCAKRGAAHRCWGGSVHLRTCRWRRGRDPSPVITRRDCRGPEARVVPRYLRLGSNRRLGGAGGTKRLGRGEHRNSKPPEHPWGTPNHKTTSDPNSKIPARSSTDECRKILENLGPMHLRWQRRSCGP